MRLFPLMRWLPLAGVLVGPVSAHALTGVCPDGSIYIVQRAESIPCIDSKQVRPEEVPPLKPEMLPRPYGWEVFKRRNDPNNPYNLVDTARAVRGGSEPPLDAGAGFDPAREATPPEYARSGAGLPPVSGPPPLEREAEAFDLALDGEEVRDLALIVEYSQRHAPATLVLGDAGGSPALVLRIAQSRSFEARLRDAAKRAGKSVRGPTVLFTAESAADETFHANLTFVQGHLAFHPDAAKFDELGLLDGRLGRLASSDRVLGYVVLPEHMDLSQPMDIYWNDRQLTATLRP
jgi:hypothetical protein